VYRRFNKKANSMVFYIVFKRRPKLCVVVLKDHEKNLVQEIDINANGVDKIASMLWDIIVS